MSNNISAETVLSEFKMIATKYSKQVTERYLMDRMALRNDKNLAHLLILHYLLVNWGSVKEAKSTAAIINASPIFSNTDPANIFSDKRELISRSANLLLQ